MSDGRKWQSGPFQPSDDLARLYERAERLHGYLVELVGEYKQPAIFGTSAAAPSDQHLADLRSIHDLTAALAADFGGAMKEWGFLPVSDETPEGQGRDVPF